MKSMTLSTRIDESTKIAFTQVCEEVGLSPSQAMQLFAKAVVNYGGIPFEIKTHKPNVTTVKAMQAFDNQDDKESLTSADDFSQLLTDLDVDTEIVNQINTVNVENSDG